MKQDDLYIGWQAKAPASYAKVTRLAIIFILLLTLGIAILYPINQAGFSNSTSELGKFTQIEGVIYKYPVPMLKVKSDAGIYHNLLLCGFGKQDAFETINYLEEKHGNLEEQSVKLNTEMIYFDGKTILEVPFFKNKDVSVQKLDKPFPERKAESLGQISLEGEIVDAKCYLGVMKPGYGKIHRSCGVRCISGGIPALLITQNGEGNANYFIITGEDGSSIQDKLLPYVGKAVKVSGQLEKVDEWMVLRISTTNIQQYSSQEFKSIYYSEN